MASELSQFCFGRFHSRGLFDNTNKVFAFTICHQALEGMSFGGTGTFDKAVDRLDTPPLREGGVASNEVRNSASLNLFSSRTKMSSHTAFHFNGSLKALVKMSADIRTLRSYTRLTSGLENCSANHATFTPCVLFRCRIVGFCLTCKQISLPCYPHGPTMIWLHHR